jgi:hypothetical protein
MPVDYSAIYRLIVEIQPEIKARVPIKIAVTLARALSLFATAERHEYRWHGDNLEKVLAVTRQMRSSSDCAWHATLRVRATRILDDIAAFHKLPMTAETATIALLMYTIAYENPSAYYQFHRIMHPVIDAPKEKIESYTTLIVALEIDIATIIGEYLWATTSSVDGVTISDKWADTVATLTPLDRWLTITYRKVGDAPDCVDDLVTMIRDKRPDLIREYPTQLNALIDKLANNKNHISFPYIPKPRTAVLTDPDPYSEGMRIVHNICKLIERWGLATP